MSRGLFLGMLLLAGPTLAGAAEPVSLALEARYGREADMGAGLRATGPFSVEGRELAFYVSLGRFFDNPMRYSEITLGLQSPLLRRGGLTLYVGGGVCAGRVELETLEVIRDRYDPRGTEVKASRAEAGLHAALGVRVHRRVLIEARAGSGRVESGLLTFGLLF